MIEVEICVADPGGVAAAVAGGADRIELCTGLELGGLTPSIGAVQLAYEQAGDAFVTVLIRPRAGDFVYDDNEAALMLLDIEAIRRWADAQGWPGLGFTIGALTPDGAVNEALTERLIAASGSRRIVFHKAFDSVTKPQETLEILHSLGVESVLTSGGGGVCVDNLEALNRLASGAPIAVTAAGGVRPNNVALVAASGVQRVHLRAPALLTSLSEVASEYDQATREVTDVEVVAQTVAAVRRADSPGR